MNDYSGYLVGVGALVAIVATWMAGKRDGKRADRVAGLDPVSLVTEANRAAYDALQGTIETLQEQVQALTAKLDQTERTLQATNDKLAEVQADLLVTKTENRALRAKVTELTEALTKYGHI